MGQSDRLKSLADNELLAELAAVVRKRNAVNAELLEYLAELDERRLFLDLGFPSLFAYCVESLGLSEATAGRYIAVARVCQAYPVAFSRVANGELHASALSLMKQHLTAANAEELFALCAHKSARQVELLLAARCPKPDVRDSIRRLPNPQNPTLNVESPAARPRLEPKKAARIEPIATDRFGVHFTADGEFCELLERVRGLAGHRLPSGDLLTLMKRGLEAYEREVVKERFAVGAKVRGKRAAKAAVALGTSTQPARAPKRRLAAAAVRRAVFARDGGQCSFVSPDGRRCEARKFLELDHIHPFAKGGEASRQNLRRGARRTISTRRGVRSVAPTYGPPSIARDRGRPRVSSHPLITVRHPPTRASCRPRHPSGSNRGL